MRQVVGERRAAVEDIEFVLGCGRRKTAVDADRKASSLSQQSSIDPSSLGKLGLGASLCSVLPAAAFGYMIVIRFTVCSSLAVSHYLLMRTMASGDHAHDVRHRGTTFACRTSPVAPHAVVLPAQVSYDR